MKLGLGRDEVWKERFRASSIAWAAVANLDPRRGLVCTDRDGIFQLYAWDVESGDLRRLTDRETGVVSGLLSSDGRYVYYLQDDGGNEIDTFIFPPIPWSLLLRSCGAERQSRPPAWDAPGLLAPRRA